MLDPIGVPSARPSPVWLDSWFPTHPTDPVATDELPFPSSTAGGKVEERYSVEDREQDTSELQEVFGKLSEWLRSSPHAPTPPTLLGVISEADNRLRDPAIASPTVVSERFVSPRCRARISPSLSLWGYSPIIVPLASSAEAGMLSGEDPVDRRYEALKQLGEIQSALAANPDLDIRTKGVAACRAAIAFMQAWPDNIDLPEIDADEDGTIFLEQYEDEDTLRALFVFTRSDRAAISLYRQGNISHRGVVYIDNMTDRRRIFDQILETAEG